MNVSSENSDEMPDLQSDYPPISPDDLGMAIDRSGLHVRIVRGINAPHALAGREFTPGFDTLSDVLGAASGLALSLAFEDLRHDCVWIEPEASLDSWTDALHAFTRTQKEEAR